MISLFKNAREQKQSISMVLENNRQLWIEVKNFRGDSAANQLRLSPTENDVPGLVDTRNFVEEKQWKDQITVSRKKAIYRR